MHKKRAVSVAALDRPKTRAYKAHNANSMIIHVTVTLKKIFKKGRHYPWQPPDKCPRCKRYKVWGHGYRDTFFEGYNSPIPLKRWRCPQCGCVICYRPKGYFPRFQTPIQTIRSILFSRLQCGRWPPGFVRCRAGHWLRSLKKRVVARLGNTWSGDLLAAFDYFIRQGQIPVSRSI